MIVKVQLPLYTTEAKPQAFVYTEKREIMFEMDIKPELVQKMPGTYKAYFHATIDKKGKLTIGERAAEQAW